MDFAGPKSANVTEEHKLVTKTPGGFVVEARVSTSAPKGGCERLGVAFFSLQPSSQIGATC